MGKWSGGVMECWNKSEHYSITPILHSSIASAIEENVPRHRVKNRATADRFAEGFAEVAEAGVTDLGGRFGDVISAGAQKLGRALHPELAQILRNGEADFAGKTAAKVKRTATDFAAEHFERRRLREIAGEQFFGSLRSEERRVGKECRSR